MASFAKMLNQPLQEKDAPDSFGMLDQLFGKSDTERPHFVHQGISTIALIQGNWKYIVPNKGPKISEFTNIEMGSDPLPQLYNLKEDKGETRNLATDHPEKVKELSNLLLKIKEDGRTRF
jgi:arylsulfatase A-like enzyme